MWKTDWTHYPIASWRWTDCRCIKRHMNEVGWDDKVSERMVNIMGDCGGV